MPFSVTDVLRWQRRHSRMRRMRLDDTKLDVSDVVPVQLLVALWSVVIISAIPSQSALGLDSTLCPR